MKASFVLLLLLSLVGLSLQWFFQDWTPIDNPSSRPDLRDVATKTIAWYNGQHNTSIVLVNVTSGFVQTVGYQGHGEYHFALNMDARPEPLCPPSNYRAVVFVYTWPVAQNVYYGFDNGTFVTPPNI